MYTSRVLAYAVLPKQHLRVLSYSPWLSFFKSSLLLCVRLNHDVAVCQNGGHDGGAEDGVHQDHDGYPADRVEGGQKEEPVVGVEPGNGPSVAAWVVLGLPCDHYYNYTNLWRCLWQAFVGTSLDLNNIINFILLATGVLMIASSQLILN